MGDGGDNNNNNNINNNIGAHKTAVKYSIMIPYIYRSPSLPRHFRAIAQLTLPASLGGTINPIFYGLGKPKKVVELAEVTQHISDSTVCRVGFSPSFPLYPDPPRYMYPYACADTLTHMHMLIVHPKFTWPGDLNIWGKLQLG